MTRAALARFAAALTSAIFVAGILAWTPAAADETADRQAAVAAATQEGTQWLGALDGHRYTDSWTEAAAVMKDAPPAIETVLMVLEEGHWRIGGYSVERAPAPETPPSGKDKAGAGPTPKAKQ